MKQTENKQSYTPKIDDFASIEVVKYTERVYKYKKIQIEDYTDLAYKVRNILETCRIALLNDTEKIEGFQVAEVLEIAQELIPYEEFELLNELHNQVIQNEINIK